MIFEGTVCSVGHNMYAISCNQTDEPLFVNVEPQGGEIHVGDSVVLNGAIYKCRVLLKDFTYREIQCIEPVLPV